MTLLVQKNSGIGFALGEHELSNKLGLPLFPVNSKNSLGLHDFNEFHLNFFDKSFSIIQKVLFESFRLYVLT